MSEDACDAIECLPHRAGYPRRPGRTDRSGSPGIDALRARAVSIRQKTEHTWHRRGPTSPSTARILTAAGRVGRTRSSAAAVRPPSPAVWWRAP